MSLPAMDVKNTSEQLRERVNHTMSFRQKKHVNNTESSKYLWKLKENIDYNLQWRIEAYASSYKCGTRKRDLLDLIQRIC